jgi:hypothetical protein
MRAISQHVSARSPLSTRLAVETLNPQAAAKSLAVIPRPLSFERMFES